MPFLAEDFLIYGATGYTGELIARAAAERGLRPILGARRAGKLELLADGLGLSCRTFVLDEPNAVDAGLSGISAVLNVAGPFSATAKPMLDACLRAGAHYLDITGEIDVFEACAARDAAARDAGIMILPGVGFDVVPSDCLAAHIKTRLPGARRLALAISAGRAVSRGTLRTGIESIGAAVRVRREGKIVALATPTRRAIDFGDGPEPAVAVGWGDVSTAYYSTGIPDITVFFKATGAAGVLSQIGPLTRGLLATPALQRLMQLLVRTRPEGPSAKERIAGRSVLVAEGEDESGKIVRSRLETPEAYALTVQTSLAVVDRVIAGKAKPGFQTPSKAFGADLALEMPGTRRIDL